MFRPVKIVVHHSLTEDSGTVSWDDIERYHTQTKKWKDIGYHAGVEEVSGGQYICMYGRPIWMPGAHTIGQNSSSLGFCFVGNYDERVPGESRLRMAARRVVAPWCLTYRIDPLHIYGHRDFAEKTCPGLLFNLDELRQYVQEELHVANLQG